MEAENEKAVAPALPHSPGPRLRAAREAEGLTLADISARSHITQRHLEMLEKEDFGGLPARTYAMGFARTYASIVGLDPGEISTLVRRELDASDVHSNRHRAAAFEPGDPARIPSRGLGWAAGIAAVLLLAGGFTFYRSFFAPGGELPPLSDPKPAAAQAQATSPAENKVAPSGPVTFTALEEGVWVKFYDGTGKQLMQKQMAKGERYTVPADAQGPQIWTGRPDALAITVGGKDVPKLAESEGIMKDVPITAEALIARSREAAKPAQIATSPTD